MVFGMITAPRKKSYLSRSVLSLRAEWPDVEVVISAEPDSRVFVPKSTVIQNSRRLGCYLNWCNLAVFLLTSKAEWYCLLEDDIMFTTGTRAKIEQQMSLGPSVISAYTAQTQGRGTGWRRVTQQSLYTHGLLGSLCMVIHSSLLPFLVNVLRLDHINLKADAIDAGIGVACMNLNYPLYHHGPTLVLHEGVLSTDLSRKYDSPNRRPYADVRIGG